MQNAQDTIEDYYSAAETSPAPGAFARETGFDRSRFDAIEEAAYEVHADASRQNEVENGYYCSCCRDRHLTATGNEVQRQIDAELLPPSRDRFRIRYWG